MFKNFHETEIQDFYLALALTFCFFSSFADKKKYKMKIMKNFEQKK